jgi:hypothetical protein
MKRLLGIIHEISGKGPLVIHILLAIAVTVHVLLHKRDIRASIGWMGTRVAFADPRQHPLRHIRH